MSIQVPDRLQIFTSETGQELTFSNFVRYHDYEPERLLVNETWTCWKARAQLGPIPTAPDIARLKKTLTRAASISGPKELALMRQVVQKTAQGAVADALDVAGVSALPVYRIWGDTGGNVGIASLEEAFAFSGNYNS